MRSFLASITLCNAVRLQPPTALRAIPAASRFANGQSRRPKMTVAPTQSRFITGEEGNNVTPYIANLVGRNLHTIEDHPLGIIKAKIEKYFNSLDGTPFEIVDDLDPLVKGQECFDDLLIPPDHPGRKPSDTYYVSRLGGREVSSAEDMLMRTHTSAHQSTLMRAGKEAFLCTGDVYRRDEIDATHFPVFHQMEGVKLFDPELVGGEMGREEWLASPGCELVVRAPPRRLDASGPRARLGPPACHGSVRGDGGACPVDARRLPTSRRRSRACATSSSAQSRSVGLTSTSRSPSRRLSSRSSTRATGWRCALVEGGRRAGGKVWGIGMGKVGCGVAWVTGRRATSQITPQITPQIPHWIPTAPPTCLPGARLRSDPLGRPVQRRHATAARLGLRPGPRAAGDGAVLHPRYPVRPHTRATRATRAAHPLAHPRSRAGR